MKDFPRQPNESDDHYEARYKGSFSPTEIVKNPGETADAYEVRIAATRAGEACIQNPGEKDADFKARVDAAKKAAADAMTAKIAAAKADAEAKPATVTYKP